MARWKARVEFLLSVIELLFLSLTAEALQGKMCQNALPSGGVGHFEPRFQGKGSSPCQYIDTTRKAIECSTTLPLTLFIHVLHRRSRPKYDNARHFDPHFEEVRGGVEPWLMARWKARVEFLLSVIELLFTARRNARTNFVQVSQTQTTTFIYCESCDPICIRF